MAITIKPQFGGRGGGGLVVQQPGHYIIKGPDGQVIEDIDATGKPGEHGIKVPSHAIHNGVPVGSHLVGPDGFEYPLDHPDNRLVFDEGNAKPTTVGGLGDRGAGGGGVRPGGAGGAQGMFPVSGGGFVGSGPGAVPLPSYIDPSALYQPFSPTDILGFAGQTAGFNRQNYQQSFSDAQGYAQQLINTELTSLQAFAGGAQTLQEGLATQGNQYNRGEIGTANKFNTGEFHAANTFNQSELDRTLQGAAPFIRPGIEGAVKRNETYASGKLLSTAEDRAFELTARSLSADNSFVSGYGGDSALADKASTLLSAQQRLQLSQSGDQALSGWLSKANDILVSKPLQYTPLIQQPLQSTIAGDIKGQPRIAGSQIALDQTAVLAGLTTINPGQATDMQVRQNQFGQQMNFDQRVAVYSALASYANTQLGQLNAYSSLTAGYAQQGVNQNFAQAGLNPNGLPPASPPLSSAVPPIYSPSTTSGTSGTTGAPAVATQAQRTRSPQLTTDSLYNYYNG